MPTPRKYADNAARHRAFRERRQQALDQALAAKGMPAAPPIASMPGKARWQALHKQALANLQALREEMQNYHDDRSPQWQEGERGEAMAEAVQDLDEILSGLDTWDLP